jgi:hypothetical protein
MRWNSAVCFAFLFAGNATAQRLVSVDSIMTVRGIVEFRTDKSDSTGTWLVFLPAPITVKNLKTNNVALAGGERVATRFIDRYVEVQGRVAVERDATGRTLAIANEPRITEVHPQGLVQEDVELSLSEHATVQLAVVPRAAALHDSTGAPSGVTPTVLFSIVNHSQTELRYFFPTTEVVCVGVQRVDADQGTEIIWKVAGNDRQVILRMGAVFRQIVAIPDSIARVPGRYVVRAALCGADQLRAETTFDVLY